MKKTMIRIDVDGTVTSIPNKGLGSLQEAVGGYVEAVGCGDTHAAYLNEEGKLIGLPVNVVATRVWCLMNATSAQNPPDLLCGPVVIVRVVDDAGEHDGEDYSPAQVVWDAIGQVKDMEKTKTVYLKSPPELN